MYIKYSYNSILRVKIGLTYSLGDLDTKKFLNDITEQ